MKYSNDRADRAGLRISVENGMEKLPGYLALNVDENEGMTTAGDDVVGRGYFLETSDLDDGDTVIELDGDPDEDIDDDDEAKEWPLFVRGTIGDGAQLELRLYADDPSMEMLSIIPGSGGGLAPTVSGNLIDLFRQRDPRRGCEEIIPLYV